MVDPAVREQLESAASPEEVHSFLIEWTDMPEDSLFATASSKRERQQRMEGFYRNLKEATFKGLRSEQGLQIRDLPASGQAIITGAAANLEKLVSSGGRFDLDQKVQVYPNVTFNALKRD